MKCSIYLTDAGFEARMGYDLTRDPLATQYALTLDLARQNAATFKEAVTANPKFSEAKKEGEPLKQKNRGLRKICGCARQQWAKC